MNGIRRKPEEDLNFYRLSGFDVILIAAVIFFSIISIPGPIRGKTISPDSKMALINIGGELYQRIDLKEDRLITLPVSTGEMKIEVKEGKVRVVSSDCPRQVCVHQGAIAHPEQILVCVPNKVLIEIKSTASFLDAVVH